MTARRGMSLVEVVIAATLTASVATLVASVISGVETSTRVGAARLEALAVSRRAVELVAIELRDLHLAGVDLEPDAPFAASELRYRIVSGYSGGAIELDPPRASGNLRRIALQGGQIVREEPGLLPVVLVDGVRTLSMTLEAPDWLVLEVGVARTVGPGDEVWGISRVRLLLNNRT